MTTTDPRLGFPSCSSLERIVCCTASHRRGQEARLRVNLDNRADDAALEGQRIHAALAAEMDADDLTIWERWTYDRCREIEQELVTELGLDGEDVMSFPGERLWWHDPSESAEVNLTGEYDKLYTNGKIALILDYKSGRVDVDEAADNWQLHGYTWLAYEKSHRIPKTVTTFYMAIIQPLGTHPLTMSTLNASEIPMVAKRISTRLEMAKNPAAKATAGAHCRYCPARGSCKEAKEYVEESIVPISDVKIVKNGRKKEVVVPILPPEQIAEYLPKRSVITAIMKALAEQAKAYARDEKLPGWALKQGDERTTFTNALGAYKALIAIGCTPEQLAECVKVSVEKLDALVTSLGVPAKESRAWWQEKLSKYISITHDADELVEVKE